MPYRQSWMDDFFDWVECLPFPYFLFYFFFYLFLILSQHAGLWLDGTLQLGKFAVIIFVQNVWFVFIGATWHYARRNATLAIERFRPALKVSPKEFELLKFRFTRLPRRTGWFLTLMSIVALVPILPLFQEYYGSLFFSPYTRLTTLLASFLIFPFNLGAFYSVGRMLLAINNIYTRVRKINLFNLTPLYALSRFTSRMGMIFLFFLLVNLLTPYFGVAQEGGVDTFYTVFNSLFAIAVFIVPLLGIHRRLAIAKDQAVEANNDLIEAGFGRMQSLVKHGKHAAVAQIRASNAALLDYRTELNKISTWPWDTATLRTFLTALLLPMTIWIVEQILLRTVVK